MYKQHIESIFMFRHNYLWSVCVCDTRENADCGWFLSFQEAAEEKRNKSKIPQIYRNGCFIVFRVAWLFRHIIATFGVYSYL